MNEEALNIAEATAAIYEWLSAQPEAADRFHDAKGFIQLMVWEKQGICNQKVYQNMLVNRQN